MSTHVLIVDDEPAVGELLQAFLEAASIQAEVETNGAKALARLRGEKFDVVFLDIQMPAPDGIELARQVRASEKNQSTRIIMITGERDVERLQNAYLAGANSFLFKPFDRGRMLRLLRASGGTGQQERRNFQRVPARCRVWMESSHGKLEGTTVDLSFTGLHVEADPVWPVGTRTHVALELPGAPERLHLAGSIVRSIGGRMGIEMEKLNADDREALLRFLLPLILSADQDATNP